MNKLKIISFCLLLLVLLNAHEDEEFIQQEQEQEQNTDMPPTPIVKSARITQNYVIEIIFGIAIVTYLAIFFAGRRTNENLAKTWLFAHKSLFENEFAFCGVSEQPDGPLLQKSHHNEYKFYASGRVNIVSMMITLGLKNRHDLIAILYNIVQSEKDKMIIDIPIQMAEPLLLVFAICKKKDAKQIHNNTTDLKNFSRKVNVDEANFPATMQILTSSDEAVQALVTPTLSKILCKYEKYIHLIQLSDQKDKTFFARFEFLLPHNTSEMENFVALSKFALTFVDEVSQIKLSNNEKKKAMKERMKQAESQQREQQNQREEQIAKKKADKKAADEEKLKNMTKEQQRKYEEKMQKKEQKKKGPKVKMLKM